MNFKTDGLGFRRSKEVVGQGVTYFVYDLAASDTPGLAPLVAEYDADGNLIAKYHHDGGGLLAMTRGNQSYWHVFEAIGTVRQLVNAQTQVTDSYAFDAWGNELAVQGNTVNPHRYVGKHGYYLDTQSALMLLGVRYYNANVGRFWSLDPIRDGRNWHSYVNNNPILYIDPLGTLPINFVGCDKQQQSTILAGFNLLCSKQNQLDYCYQCYCAFGLRGRINCFTDYCNPGHTITIQCIKKLSLEYLLICKRTACGAAMVGRGWIFICPSFWTTRCPPAHCVLGHELIHTCGVLKHQRDCFNCIPNAFPSCPRMR